MFKTEHKMIQAFIILITSHVMVSLMVVWLKHVRVLIKGSDWTSVLSIWNICIKQLKNYQKRLQHSPSLSLAVSYWIYHTETDRLILAGLSNSSENIPTLVSELAGFKLQ